MVPVSIVLQSGDVTVQKGALLRPSATAFVATSVTVRRLSSSMLLKVDNSDPQS